jgi:hypothetical protein
MNTKKSFQEAEDYKTNVNKKKEVYREVADSQMFVLPVVVYVKNDNLPDINQTVYLFERWLDVKQIIQILKTRFIDTKLPFSNKTKLALYTEHDNAGPIVEDILLEELYEYEVNNDRTLYLILDFYHNENYSLPNS